MSDWFPYYDHLSLFVFCSGYLYRREDEEHIGAWFVKKLRRLILPLYLYNLAYGLLVQDLRLLGFTIGGAVQFNTAGVDFALTALFLTIFTDRWIKTGGTSPPWSVCSVPSRACSCSGGTIFSCRRWRSSPPRCCSGGERRRVPMPDKTILLAALIMAAVTAAVRAASCVLFARRKPPRC